jgi:hypothetical protein
MKKIFTLVLGLLTSICFAQDGFHLKYNVNNVPLDSNRQTLNVYSKDGNSINEFIKNTDGVVWYKSLKLKKHSNTDYKYFGDDYIKMDDNQLKKYLVEIIGTEKIDNYNCTKISVQTYEKGGKTLIWITNEIKDFQKYLTADVQVFNLNKLNEALKIFKLSGFPIRIEYSGNPGQVYTFIKAEFINIDDSLFKLDNSKKSEGHSSEYLKRKDKVTDEQYKQMKIEEEKVKKEMEEKMKNEK